MRTPAYPPSRVEVSEAFSGLKLSCNVRKNSLTSIMRETEKHTIRLTYISRRRSGALILS